MMPDPYEIMADMASARPMLASAVIARLQAIMRDHGDLPVILADRDVTLREIIPYDADGNTVGKPTEIGLRGW